MFALKRPIAILMFTIALSIFGVRSMQNINTSFLPEIEYPEFTVICQYPGSSAEEVEKYITQPLEESFSSLASLRDIISYSRDGQSIINLQFDWKINTRFNLLRIREKIDAVYDNFPENAEHPLILDFNPGSMPILQFTFSGNTDITELASFARDVIKPRFSQIHGVSSAQISGMPSQAVQIITKPEKLSKYQISQSQIENSILSNLPGRSFSQRVKVGYAEHSITVDFPIKNIYSLNQLPIDNSRGIPVTLKDVADIKEIPQPLTSCVFYDTTAALAVNIYKEAGSNSIEACNNAVTLINTLSEDHPEFNFRIIKNQGAFVSQSLSSLKQSIGLGAVLAFLVILLFLKKLRLSLILALAIPVCLLLAFNALFIHNITFNIMTLGGLALGIGLIVDNGIVMLDSLSKHYHPLDIDNSLYQGLTKVGRAIAASTFTTIAIFFPIIYVSGYSAILFREQALTISYTLLFSLITALVLVPSFFKIFIKKPTHTIPEAEPEQNEKKITRLLKKTVSCTIHKIRDLFRITGQFISGLTKPIFDLFDTGYKKTYDLYHTSLISALKNKKIFFLILLIPVFIAVLSYVFILSTQYWPDVASDKIELTLETPREYPYELIVSETKNTIQNLLTVKNNRNVTTQVFSPAAAEAADPQNIFYSPGYYTVRFAITLHNRICEKDFDRNEYRNAVTLPYDNITISHPTALKKEFSQKRSSNFMVYFAGSNRSEKIHIAKKLLDYLHTVSSVNEPVLSSGGMKEVQYASFKPEISSKYDISYMQASEKLEILSRGRQIGWWQQGLHKIPVILQSREIGVKKLSDLMAQLNDPAGNLLRNEQIFNLTTKKKILERKRVNRKSVISVEGYVSPAQLGKVNQKVEKWIKMHPSETDIFISGESKRISSSFSQLFKAFMFAALIVYLILAAQFESFFHPLNIIITVPVGFMGAVLGLIIFGQSLNVISLIGIIMLIGIGVNDAIIKLDYMVLLRKKEKMNIRPAVLQASKEKFRPILMTTVTTIAAMFPMALGFGGNAEINQPLAVTIIGGLFFTTVLTLFITPVIFEVWEENKEKR